MLLKMYVILFSALCPPGQTQTDASPTTTEFDLVRYVFDVMCIRNTQSP